MSTPWALDVLNAQLHTALEKLAAADARGDLLAEALKKAHSDLDIVRARAERLAAMLSERVGR